MHTEEFKDGSLQQAIRQRQCSEKGKAIQRQGKDDAAIRQRRCSDKKTVTIALHCITSRRHDTTD